VVCQVGISILNPDGTILTNDLCMGNTTGDGFIGEQALVQPGTYTLFVQPGSNTGTLTVQLWAVTDISGTITPGGSPVPVNFATPGQTARFTFSGNVGQQVSAHTSNSNFGSCSVGMSILNPNATTLTSNICMGSNGSELGSVTLGTGTYTLYVYPSLATTGGLTVTLTSP
jgi:hypothetical protein